jgi:hypothetical protein
VLGRDTENAEIVARTQLKEAQIAVGKRSRYGDVEGLGQRRRLAGMAATWFAELSRANFVSVVLFSRGRARDGN